MKRIPIIVPMTVLAMALVSACKSNEMSEEKTPPPVAEKVPYEMVAHNDTRVDDYYWMRLSDEQKSAEDPDEATQKVLNYLNAENSYLEAKMKHTEGFQKSLFDEIVGRIKKDDADVPVLDNGYYYYTRYEEGKEYEIYCRKKGSLDAEEEIILDVNELAEGHEYYAIGGFSVSPDNKLLAFSEDTISRRQYVIMVKDLTTGEVFEDRITNTTGGAAWANDNKTLFYTSKNEVTLLSEKIYRHTLGEPTANDKLMYHEKDPSYYIGVGKSKSGKYIAIYASSTLVNDYLILDADQPMGEFKQFSPREKDHKYSIEHFKDKFYIISNWDAVNFKLMETSVSNTSKENWKEVIAHRSDVYLMGMEVFESHLVLRERKMGNVELRVINQKSGDEHYIDFGEPAYYASVSNNREFNTEILRFNFSSLTTPFSVYDYNLNSKERSLMKRTEVIGGHDPEQYVSERIYATASDGAKIPISVVYKKGFEKNGTQPLLLYGYGSYGNIVDPYFSSVRLSLLNRGFAFAIAHVRGSSFMGREWYENGKMFHKKNSFSDFVACGQYLIDQKYTNNDMIFAQGGSAGGLLMGAVLNLAPTMFEGVIAAVPFVDVVTTMSDPTIPLTTNEYDEWGNPENEDSYFYMKEYSPYDQVQATNYTNILVTTGLFDSQVQYWEPAKWVAKLRDMKTDDNLLIMHTNMEAGHGGASGRYKRYKETALEYAFMLNLAGIKE